jgi:hypothetical protein
MKKLLLLSLTFLLISCEDTGTISSKNLSINPPKWIQGVWIDKDLSRFNMRMGYEFKIDDLCQIIYAMSSCNKENLKLFSSNDIIFADVQEQITNTRYAIDITYQSTTTSYIFEKVDDNQIIQKGKGVQVIDKLFVRE